MNSYRTNDEQVADPWAALTELERQPLRAARRIIALRLSESWRNVVPVTLYRDLDVSRISASRELGGPRFLDHVLHGTAQALRAHPAFNAIFDGTVRRVFAEVNVGFAVDTPRGLVVPVLRNVQDMSASDIAVARRAATNLVIGWKQSASDLIGGTFTVSNLGSLGVDYFTPIVNSPQVAILGLGRVRRQAIAWSTHGRPRVRSILPVSFTVDHRVLDGADAAKFLQTLEELLSENSSLSEASIVE